MHPAYLFHPVGFAAIMASTYKAYLGEGLGPLEWIKQFHIPHPGRVIGRLVLHATMPGVLGWVLGGNNGHLEAARPSACRMEDRLKVGDVCCSCFWVCFCR
jgi:zeaxanthin epoxidase